MYIVTSFVQHAFQYYFWVNKEIENIALNVYLQFTNKFCANEFVLIAFMQIV